MRAAKTEAMTIHHCSPEQSLTESQPHYNHHFNRLYHIPAPLHPDNDASNNETVRDKDKEHLRHDLDHENEQDDGRDKACKKDRDVVIDTHTHTEIEKESRIMSQAICNNDHDRPSEVESIHNRVVNIADKASDIHDEIKGSMARIQENARVTIGDTASQSSFGSESSSTPPKLNVQRPGSAAGQDPVVANATLRGWSTAMPDIISTLTTMATIASASTSTSTATAATGTRTSTEDDTEFSHGESSSLGTETVSEETRLGLLVDTAEKQQSGVELWRAWHSQQCGEGPRIGDFTPLSFMQYLDSVVIPLEEVSSHSNADAQAKPGLIETYIKPVLNLWHEQQLLSQYQRLRQHEEDRHNNGASVLDRTMSNQRQQNHHQRITQLERSHRETASVIAQLQDQVYQLMNDRISDQHPELEHRDMPQRQPLMDRESSLEPQNAALDRSGDHAQDEKKEQHVGENKPKAASTPQYTRYARDHGQSWHANGLVEAIVKSLEEYHGRMSNGFLRHSTCTQKHHCPPPHRSLPPVLMSEHQDKTHAGSDADTYLHSYPPPHEGLPCLGQDYERPIRSRKRTSSMNGPGCLVKETAKLARSCSPPRPRARPGTASYVMAGGEKNTDDHHYSHHSHSQPPSSSLVPPSAWTPSHSKLSTETTVTMDPAVPSTVSWSQEPCSVHLTHSSRQSRSTRYDDDEDSSPYHSSRMDQNQHTQYNQHRHQPRGHAHPEDSDRKVSLHGSTRVDDNLYSPYFLSSSTSVTKDKHSKGYGSYLDNNGNHHLNPYGHHQGYHDSQGFNGYDQAQPQISNYKDFQEEDVKSSQHQLFLEHYQRHTSQDHKQQQQEPIYVMNRQVNTVPELWKEWTVGLGPGCPSIRQLEAQYGPSWRTSSSAANFFSRRLRIINEIQRMIDVEGMSEEEAVDRMEARREQGVVIPGTEGMQGPEGSGGFGSAGGIVQPGGMSLHRLSEVLRKKQL